VALADLDESAVQAVAKALTAAGHKAIAIRCNAAIEVAAIIEQMVAAFSRLDMTYNNA
jgi:hypothetical protein